MKKLQTKYIMCKYFIITENRKSELQNYRLEDEFKLH